MHVLVCTYKYCDRYSYNLQATDTGAPQGTIISNGEQSKAKHSTAQAQQRTAGNQAAAKGAREQTKQGGLPRLPGGLACLGWADWAEHASCLLVQLGASTVISAGAKVISMVRHCLIREYEEPSNFTHASALCAEEACIEESSQTRAPSATMRWINPPLLDQQSGPPVSTMHLVCIASACESRAGAQSAVHGREAVRVGKKQNKDGTVQDYLLLLLNPSARGAIVASADRRHLGEIIFGILPAVS
ncbi:hypothetical protein V8C44DRAFT_331207 [Trichoderma aethiopicum]